MAETIDEILNGSDEGTEVDQQVDDVEEGQDDDQPTGEDNAQVAAENNDQDDGSQTEVRAELKALAKERERIRQKEAALDAERARLADAHAGNRDAADAADTADAGNVPLRELRKQYREALKASVYEPDDVEAEKRVEELEERIDAAQAQQVQQEQTKKVTEQEFSEVFADVHTAYPFLDPDHPQVNAELNADINAYYFGKLQQGKSKAVALRDAVEKFAPAYAKKLGLAGGTATKPSSSSKSVGVAREKLKGGFSEVPGTGSSTRSGKLFSGPTPMEDILGRSST